MTYILDLHFLGHSDTIAAFLVETQAGPILIETGPYSTFAQLKAGVEASGFRLEDIKHVFLTHIHLDHAGAAWALAEHGATIYVHPFGAKHLHEPEKLIQSATRIYGDEMERLWSTMKGIPESQLKLVEHGAAYAIGGQLIKAWHTPGHAVHHIAWQIGQELFAGDVAGVKIGNGPVVPPCPPPDINIEDWKRSIELIKSLDLTKVYLTHYGPIDQIGAHLNSLEEILIDWANWMRPHYEAGTDAKLITPLFQQYVQNQLRKEGINEEGLARYESANPSWMSVAGLLRYWRKKITT